MEMVVREQMEIVLELSAFLVYIMEEEEEAVQTVLIVLTVIHREWVRKV